MQAAIRNLVLMISSLCMCGMNELRPPATSQIASSFMKMQNNHHTIPSNSSRDTSVRNVYAFQVLQAVFLNSTSTTLCCTILDAISRVYHSDNMNYFILETENTLNQFIERIHTKNSQIQEKFFDLMEFIVFQLNFVPCTELISLSLLLKNNHSTSCSILCLKTLLNILRHNNVFKDVYREVGILEVFVTCLNNYTEFVHQITAGDKHLVMDNADVTDSFGKHILEILTILLSGPNHNATVFREWGGAKCVHDLVQFKHCRSEALGIIRELILSTGGDDDLLFILSVMHAVPPHQVEFKIQILNMLLSCLKDSHRTRTTFRKVGGFVYLTSVFVSLDGRLSDDVTVHKKIHQITSDNNTTVEPISQDDLILLLQIVSQTLAIAMRFEPANAKFFHLEICMASLCDTLRLLGCFATEGNTLNKHEGIFESDHILQKYYYDLFMNDILNCRYENIDI